MSDIIKQRCDDIKEQEKEALYFLKKCGVFQNRDVFIKDGYDWDIWQRDSHGREYPVADFKLQKTCFIDLPTMDFVAICSVIITSRGIFKILSSAFTFFVKNTPFPPYKDRPTFMLWFVMLNIS